MSARTDERGSASLELVILAPLLFAVLSMIFAFGWFSQTESLVDQAARDAARAATAQNARSEVDPLADEITAETLVDAPSSCARTGRVERTELSAGAFEVTDVTDPDQIETVSVTVTCDLDLSTLAFIPRLPPVTVSRTFTSPLDRYRGYQ
ncbi:MAG: TadE/TadG family type IV pilus assembly protein [Nocardioidaceae bacterium]|nr:TadE/TadG family type IV pilus assembly protein [Nocardioidaceae bacterium]